MPANLAFFLVNQYSEFFEKSLGERLLVIVTWLFLLAGILWLAALGISTGSWQVSAGLFVLGIGLGLMWTPACAISMAACDAVDQGFASGAIALSRSFFGVLGIAMLGSLLGANMARAVNDGLKAMNASPAAVRSITAAVHHGGAFAAAQHPPAGVNGNALSGLVAQSFGMGWHVALLFAALLTLVFGLVTYVFIPERKVKTASV